MNIEFKLNNKVLETERLILRPFKLEDLDDLYEYAKVDGVGEMAGWPHHENKETSLNILKMFIEEDKTFAIVLKENNKVIGSLGIEKYDEKEFPELQQKQGREIGFVLSKDYWGKGLMPEAVSRVIEFLFNEINLDFIACSHSKKNPQSARVQEKCGFKYHNDFIFRDRESIYNVLFK